MAKASTLANQRYIDKTYHIYSIKVRLTDWALLQAATTKLGITPSSVVHDAIARTIKRAGLHHIEEAPADPAD